jgi:cysteine desulfurase/selenocysteine lyase
VQRFIGARESREIVFTKGTTESINLVAHSYGERHVEPGDEILISEMEHHSNIVPWQLLCERRGARLIVAPVDDAGELQLPQLERLLGPRTRLVAITQVSNALGTRNPVERIVKLAHERGAVVLVDGAQAVPHERVDVQDLDCDFYAFSGHKLYGPTGIGVLYGKAALLEELPPYQGGGDMIRSVSFEKTTYHDLPYKFEAGTPNIAGAIGLGAALDYLEELGLERIASWEKALLGEALQQLSELPRVRLLGAPARRGSLISFNVTGIHPHDVSTVLDHEGIAVRAGHHCAQPLMTRFGVPATVRVSFACYNQPSEIRAFVAGIERACQVLG